MEQCKKCAIYSDDFNAMLKESNDLQPLDTQYCIMYKFGIPKNIADDKTVCPDMIPKEEFLKAYNAALETAQQ